MKALTSALFFICLNAIALAQQPQLVEAWKHFFEDNFDAAEQAFSSHQSGAEQTEALLGLALCDAEQYNYDAAFLHFNDFFRQHENPWPYLYALWSYDGLTSDISAANETKRILLWKYFLTKSDIPGTLAAMLHSRLAGHHQKQGDFSEAQSFRSKIGCLMNWSIIGTFENISACGFDVDHPPVRHHKNDTTITNKRGAKIKWFDLKYVPDGKWINLDYNFYTDNSVVYAQTFCTLMADQEVQLRLGVSGSVKTWVNDALVISEQKERNTNLDVYNRTIKLKAGTNRILLQMGASELEDMNFMLRLTDPSGKVLISESAANADTYIQEPYAEPGDIVPLAAETYLNDVMEKHQDHVVTKWLLTRTYLHNTKSYKARKILTPVCAQYPNSTLLINTLLNIYVQESNRTELSSLLERLKQDKPDNLMSLELRYDRHVENEEYDKAEEILNKIKNKEGNSENVRGKQIQLASKRSEIEKLYELCDKAYAEYPDNYGFVTLKYYILLEVDKNKAAALKVLKKFRKKRYHEGATEAIANHYLSNGILADINKGLNLYKELVEHKPYASGYYTKIGRIHQALRRYSEARDYFDKAKKIAPYVGSIHAEIGETYESTDSEFEAITAYKKSLELSPFNYEVRNKLRKLEDKPNLFDYFEKVDFDELYAAAPKAEAYPEDNSVILYEESQILIHKGGGVEEKHYVLTKIFNSSGIDTWKEYNIPVAPYQYVNVEKAEVLKKDGSRIEAEVNYSYVVFTNLEEGDAISLTYKIENYSFGTLSEHFWDKQLFQHYYPYLTSKYSIMHHPGLDLKHQMLNDNMQPLTGEHEGYQVLTWEKQDVAAIQHESYMSALTDVAPALYVSSLPDWSFVSNWYSDMSRTKARPDYEVKEVIETLFPAGESLTDMDKAKRIYNYIVNNIRYSSISFRQSGIIPQLASHVISTKIGDCKDVSTLFVSMCKEVGLDAKLVLINTRENGAHDMHLPSIEFNHCIAKLDLKDEEHYIELTSDYLPFGTCSQYLKGSFALEIEANGEATPFYLNPNTRVKNAYVRRADVSFGDNNLMTIVKNSTRKGSKAANLRNTYRDEGKEQREKTMLNAISDEYTGIELNELNFDENLDNNADSATYNYTYSVTNPLTKIADMYILKIPYSDNIKPIDFLAEKERKYPLQFWAYMFYDFAQEEIRIDYPKGMVLADLPESVQYSCPTASYALNFSKENGKLVVKRKLTFHKDNIPTEEFEQFKTFMNQVIDSDATQIGFKKA